MPAQDLGESAVDGAKDKGGSFLAGVKGAVDNIRGKVTVVGA